MIRKTNLQPDSFEVAILVESINSYGQGLLKGISSYILEHGPWSVYYEERSPNAPPPHWLTKWNGDGIIVRDQTGECVRVAMQTNAKVVDLGEKRQPGLPTIYPDYAAAAEMGAEHLLERGFENFGYIGIKGRHFSTARRDAFIQAVGPGCKIFELEQSQVTTPWKMTDDALSLWIAKQPKPFGVMACYDLVGQMTLESCHRQEIEVPDEVAVVGVNNDELQCELATPTMTSIAQDTHRAGYEAAALLHNLMQGNPPPKSPLKIPPLQVVSRRSTDVIAIADRTLARALQFIRDNACEGITVANVVDSVGTPRRTLERKFTEQLQRSPHDEIIRTQIRRTKELLLNSNLTITSIARKVGFRSPSHLTNVFKKQVGIAPGEFRHNHFRA